MMRRPNLPGIMSPMTTSSFIGCWAVLFLAGMVVNSKQLAGKGGGVVGNTVLMLVIACLATFFIWGLSLLSST